MVPVPPVGGFGQTCADLVEAIAYGGFRPGEILAVLGRHHAPADLGEQYVNVCQRNVGGRIVQGTKSKRLCRRTAVPQAPRRVIATVVHADG